MKLRLPLSLLSAVLTVFTIAASGAHAVEVPEDYTSNYLADPDELYDFRSDGSNVAFLLDGSLTVTPSSATWWQSSDLKSSGSVLITIGEDGDPYSLTFRDSTNQAFDINTLRIEDVGKVTFSGIETATDSSSNGAIEAGSISLLRNREVNISNNSQSRSDDDYYPLGGAIHTTSTLNINENTRGVSISGNYASSYDASYSLATSSTVNPTKYYYTRAKALGGAIYGTAISFSNNAGAVSLSDNYVSATTRCSVQSSSAYTSAKAYAYGGAIYGTTISITGNTGAVSISGNYASSSSSADNRSGADYDEAYAYGGAIYGTIISIADNAGFVSISDNYVSASSDDYAYAYGGAIYGGNNAQISLEGNKGEICISRNYADGDISCGGAIYGANDTIISIIGNEGDINITENGYSETSSIVTYDGGAIYLSGGELNIRDNANLVTIKGNCAQYGGAFYTQSSVINLEATKSSIIFESNSSGSHGGAIYCTGTTINLVADAGNIIFSSNTASSGGAVYGTENTINICNSAGDISFVDNAASSCGGAIYDQKGAIYICNNTGTVKFSGNTAQQGAAIYGDSLVIQNNESVVFEQNLENQGRLRGIYINSFAADGGQFHLSAAAGKSITFEDSVYVATATSGQVVNVVFNGSYITSDETEIAQGGDIIFDGGQVEGVLRELLGTEPTAEQIAESQTSYVGGMTNLKAGRLIIRNGAQYNGLGISTTARSGAAVVLENAGMDHSLGSINIRRGTSLELSGCNQIVADGLTLSSGSTLGFTVGEEQRTTASLALDSGLELFSITINLNGADMLASGRYKLVELADAAQYVPDDSWIADDITVTATGDAAGLGFDDLVWEDGVLYVEQGKSFWNNAAGDMSWNTASVNWVRNDVGIAYKKGMDVEFGDAGAGTVQLEGEISPLSVVVENSTGHDYTFTGSGKLTGATSLTKTGTGELSLATANEHTGGTVLDGGTLRVQHSTALGAADSTVTTAAGTLLSVENNAAVVLAAATGNSLAGRVQVQTGASLEVQGTGYHAESTQLEGELIFSGAGVNHTGEGAGTLSGSGQLKVQGSGSSAQFSSAADYTGHVALADGAEFTADKLVMKADTTLAAVAAGTSLGLEDIVQPGTAQVEMHTTRFDSYASTLHTDVAANCYSAGTLALVDGLTLEGGSTYQADGSSLNLNGGSLTLSSGSGSEMFVNLMLSLDGAYTPEVTQIVLFTGVAEFCLGGQVLSTGDTTHVFAATDYLTGDYVYETTALVYDGNVGCVYLVEAMPEPTTTTLSLLALAGLCARRRRKD